jgi:hypothetical protein
MKVSINTIEHDIVKVHPLRTNSKGDTVFNVTYKNKYNGREFRMQVNEGDSVKIIGEDMPWWLRSKDEVEKVHELMQEKLLGPEYVKLRDGLK